MNKPDKIYIAGHRGLVGAAILRHLQQQGYDNLLTATHQELDLSHQLQVQNFFQQHQPDYVFLAAAKVGGIHANNRYPAEFIYQNLAIETHVIESAYRAGVRKLLFLGSSCIYPKFAPQPMREQHLLTGELEPTNQWYAVAKIAGIKMCQAYYQQYGFKAISLMPTNLYGIGDNFHLENAHVIPALLRKFHQAKMTNAKHVEVWGTGQPRREFLYVDDLADACVFLMQSYQQAEIVNIGVGNDISIAELAQLVKKVVDYQGDIIFDPSKPDGTPRKLLDISLLSKLGWSAKTDLEQGLTHTYHWFLANQDKCRH